MVVVGFYLVAFIVSLFVVAMNLFRNQKGDNLLLLTEICVALNLFGKYLICISEGLELALFATKLQYIGAIFGPLLLTVIVAKICNIKCPKWLLGVMLGVASAIYASVFTIGDSTVYYTAVTLKRGDGYAYLDKTYGPLHTIYVILMVVNMICLVGISLYAVFYKKEVPTKTTITLATFGITIALSYIISRALHTVIQWEILFTLVAMVIVGFITDKLDMFDMSTNISRMISHMEDYGYIVFNKKYEFVSSNDFAEKVFPEIKKWKRESVVRKEDSLAYREVVTNLDDWVKNPKEKVLPLGNHYVQLSLKDIIFHNKKVGYLIEIVDKTYEHRYLETMKNYNTMLENEVEEKTADILKIKDNMVLGMAIMVEGRDNSTGGHVQRTSAVVEIFAKKLEGDLKYGRFKKSFFDDLIKAAPMHDLGKITVDDRVLRKQGKFTEEEYNEMKKHSAEGAKIVERILKENNDEEFENIATNVAHYHHEKWNGTGYPSGLKGEEIPIEARIMAFADVYDALVSKRCYKEAFSHEKAREIIENDLGSHFDPELGKVFLECKEELEALYNSYGDDV